MADPILLDTDVVSYLLRGDSRAVGFEPLIAGRDIVVSFQTVAELYRGAFRMTGANCALRWLSDVTVAPYVPPMAIAWAKIMAEARLVGITISPQDAWIGATALVHGLPLLTNNRRDFEHVQGLHLPTSGQQGT